MSDRDEDSSVATAIIALQLGDEFEKWWIESVDGTVEREILGAFAGFLRSIRSMAMSGRSYYSGEASPLVWLTSLQNGVAGLDGSVARLKATLPIMQKLYEKAREQQVVYGDERQANHLAHSALSQPFIEPKKLPTNQS